MKQTEWILCPVCGSKTRSRIREDTILINYPLYCPKCRQERLIEVRNLQTIVITEPDTFCFSTLISVSRLHFGQNNGNILNYVSGRIFIRVLLLQTGHNNHSMLLRSLLFVIWFMAAFLSQYNTADNSQATQCCAPF